MNPQTLKACDFISNMYFESVTIKMVQDFPIPLTVNCLAHLHIRVITFSFYWQASRAIITKSKKHQYKKLLSTDSKDCHALKSHITCGFHKSFPHMGIDSIKNPSNKGAGLASNLPWHKITEITYFTTGTYL